MDSAIRDLAAKEVVGFSERWGLFSEIGPGGCCGAGQGAGQGAVLALKVLWW